MKFEKKWLQIIGLALSFPSAILFMAWGAMEMIKADIVSRPVGWGLFIVVVFHYVFLMVRYAVLAKKKEDNGSD